MWVLVDICVAAEHLGAFLGRDGAGASEQTGAPMAEHRWPAVPGLLYGGDYNPEQWPEEVWPDDVALMREAGVTLVTVGVFSWALLEPTPGRFELDWLARVLDLLHAGGIAVDLATATASPPPWFSLAHPDSLPVTADGVRLSWGSRQAYCPSSPDYLAAALRLVTALAERFGDHPAVRMWHVGNEYGCHVAHCFCDTSAAAFRAFLQHRYGDLDAVNAAWGTAFWSQHYSDWEQVIPPRASPTHRNPTQQLDWWRFGSHALLELYRAERDVLRALTPALPVTTNFMAPGFKPADYVAWGAEVDLVANDHYLVGADPAPMVDLALGADLMRSVGGGRPWLLMETSTSAVNWQPRNLAKEPGQLRRNALAHVARGADGVLFFQWRASRAGAEKFHSGLVPHAGTDTRVWREVVDLGRELASLADVVGSRVATRVAILWDYEAWWGVELDSHPSSDVAYLPAVRRTYEALWRAGVTVDFAHPEGDLSGYRLLLAPSLYLLGEPGAKALAGFVRDGGSLVVSAFSGIVDENDHVWLGGYPGALREVLGVVVEEFCPLLPGQTVALSDGSTGSRWSERLHLRGAQALTTITAGALAGVPVVTRHSYGAGSATYVGTDLEPAVLGALLADEVRRAGLTPVADAPAGVEVVRRGDHLFVLNHTGDPAVVAGRTVAAGDVVVLRGA